MERSDQIVVPLLLEKAGEAWEQDHNTLAPYREVIWDCEAILQKLGESQGQGGPVAAQRRHNP